jgi:drug/metabolite transporter (DMT)-like permease
MRLAIFIFLCIVWGSTWLAIKVSLQGIPPFLGAAVRFLVAAVLVLGIAFIKRANLKISLRDFKILALTAVLMYAFDYGLIYWAEQYLSAGVTAIFFATFPLFTSIWTNFVFRNESFRWRSFVGIVIGFTGILVVFFDQLLLTHFDLMVTMASVAVVVAAAGAAASAVIIKKHIKGLNHYAITFHQMAVGVLILFTLGFLIDNPGEIEITTKVCLAVLYLGLAGSALAFVLYYWLLTQMSAITLSFIIYITPIVALVFDFIFFDELISPSACVGMILVFSGIWVSQAPLVKRPPLRAA